ncbi:MAG: class Ib ribonucleoside-diphosphate reductase assembly flavoprotein NrdI [Rothia sp. (in: high G+C Gram-positive bacteria)]|uniref:class Ib ribonucleoside-diphosphate reductase assembly flavoprotein NrdI n=1 Tax=Rothia sp. (in: high G+C Gram-positive bacteria) TaxID=1885016 RepID=UPI0026DF6E25|nr:class Ib ribonucleoside-diphosphate reductase assembly flavoprotein NrdI [Rothia sp. (in: high G+C Gram-positive bacteria)]MDO5750610.1 class Ib ribonucleoside-diphosphate reductase assembly flavoprotein NrdI [Rothia sp. (in: high G+C Gram-positive bacteria)]
MSTAPGTTSATDENAQIRQIILDARDATVSRATVSDDSPLVVYFSSISGNTHKFVQKLRARLVRLPLHTKEESPTVTEPFVLIVPTYGKPDGAGNVPPQVVKFLNNPENRAQLRGVIGAGNTNFGPLFGIAADIVSRKCDVPVLFKFELMGTPADVEKVNEGLEEFWTQNSLQR